MLQDELIKLYNSDEYPLHMPGHKRQGIGSVLDDAHGIDITEIKGYDNLYDAHGILRSAMDYAAQAYDCPHTYYLVNGSTVGVLIAIRTVADMYADEATGKRDRILIASNCHRSVTAGAELSGIGIDRIEPERIDLPGVASAADMAELPGDNVQIKAGRSIYGAVSAAAVKERLTHAESQGMRYAAVVITSPTYEGIISDIEDIAEVCHEQDTILIVDEAHGAHFDLCDAYPKGALRFGADIVIHSTHKTLAAMTQTALLHVQGELVDITIVEKYWSMLQTSSPSYVLMTSIDNALHHIRQNPQMVTEHLAVIENLRDKLLNGDNGHEGLRSLRLLVPGDLCGYGFVKGYDPYKLVIFTGASGIDGYSLQQILLDDYHIQMELATKDYILGITTYMDTGEGMERFACALLEIDDRIAEGYYNKRSGIVTERESREYTRIEADKADLYAPCIPS